LAIHTFAAAQNTERQKYDRPVLRIDPGMHTSDITSLSVDVGSTIVVSGSLDKTVRIWNAKTGKLNVIIEPPFGPDRFGQVYATALVPDGSLLAFGGWTENNLIYLADPKTGKIIQNIPGMPNVVTRLAFSPDGRYLVAGTVGLRVFDGNRAWKEVARDDDYTDAVNGISFAKDGRFVVSTQDGLVRLYNSQFHSVISVHPHGSHGVTSIAFSKDGSSVAVGLTQYPCVMILDGRALTEKGTPQTNSVAGEMATVAWSSDSKTLYFQASLGASLFIRGRGGIEFCIDRGLGECRRIEMSFDSTTTEMVATEQGALVIGARDAPYLGIYDSANKVRWEHGSPTAKFPGIHTLGVNEDGNDVDFRFEPTPSVVRFSANTESMSNHPEMVWSDNSKAISINNQGEVLLDQKAAPMSFSGEAISAALFPNGVDIAVGTQTGVTAISKSGKRLWVHSLENAVSDVQVSGNGKIVVAAVHDGTIRWLRADDGVELMALMPILRDKSTGATAHYVDATSLDWVTWTPDGLYASTTDANGVIRWLANQSGTDRVINVPVSSIPELRRPDVLKRLIGTRNVDLALGQADRALIAQKIQIATGASSPPGARLYALAVGISDYGPSASRLNLKYADNDAIEFLEKLDRSQDKGGLYSKVQPMVYPNDVATKENIVQALNVIESQMRLGDGRDVMIFFYSGHGARIDDQLFLLPYGIDASTSSKIESTALPAGQLQSKLASIAQHGFVLTLLDACRSGSMTGDGASVNPDASALQHLFSNDGVQILTSSSGTEDSIEKDEWKHGAFTKAMIDVLSDHPEYSDITVGELASELSERLGELTGNAQHLGMNPDFTHLSRVIFRNGK
jgi:WD40 repeat protein